MTRFYVCPERHSYSMKTADQVMGAPCAGTMRNLFKEGMDQVRCARGGVSAEVAARRLEMRGVLERLWEAWIKVPEARLGQLLVSTIELELARRGIMAPNAVARWLYLAPNSLIVEQVQAYGREVVTPVEPPVQVDLHEWAERKKAFMLSRGQMTRFGPTVRRDPRRG